MQKWLKIKFSARGLHELYFIRRWGVFTGGRLTEMKKKTQFLPGSVSSVAILLRFSAGPVELAVACVCWGGVVHFRQNSASPVLSELRNINSWRKQRGVPYRGKKRDI